MRYIILAFCLISCGSLCSQRADAKLQSELNFYHSKYGVEKCALLDIGDFMTSNDGVTDEEIISSSVFQSNISKEVAGSMFFAVRELEGGGNSFDENVILKKINEGYVGSLQNYKKSEFYNFFSIDEDHIIVIDISDSFIGDENETAVCSVVDPVVDCEIGDNTECLGECVGDIDILFLWSDLAKQEFASNVHRVAHMNLMMEQLRLANSNSSISNSYNYLYADYNYEIQNIMNCQFDITQFLEEHPGLYDMRDAFGADLVVFLSNPNERWDDALACVSEFGVAPDKAFAVIPIHRSLEDVLFPHELGHLFGAKHGDVSTAENGCCGRGLNVSFFDTPLMRSFNTVLAGVGKKIPYYSDPNINFEFEGFSEPTGKIFNGRMWNNAGLIRNYGCAVSEIQESINLKASISVDYNNCTLNLNSNASASTLPNNNFTWYYSDFADTYDQADYLGSGYSLSASDPIPDPCVGYFVHLVVENEGYIVHSSSAPVKGGICMDNVWCNNGNGSDKRANTNDDIFLEGDLKAEDKVKSIVLYRIDGTLVRTKIDVNKRINGILRGVYVKVTVYLSGEVSSEKIVVIE